MRFKSVYFLAFWGSASAFEAFGVDESRLWLPTSYERQYLTLKSAAEAAESLDRCVSIVRGTIDLDRSTKERPIFRILCRQDNGRTYNEMVDGVTLRTLTTRMAGPLTAEELEAQRLELERLKPIYLDRCLVELDSKSKLFINKTLIDSKPEPVEITTEEAKFYLDFNAEDINGIDLSYRATCRVGEMVDLRIRTRGE